MLVLRVAMFFCQWIAYPMLRLYGKLVGKTPMQMIAETLSDPRLRDQCARLGLAGALTQYEQAVHKQMAGLPAAAYTQADRDWQEFLLHYGERPAPERIPEWFAYLASWYLASWFDEQPRELIAAGILDALDGRHPELALTERYPDLYRRAGESVQTASQDRPGRNDYELARWFILRSPESAARVASLANLAGARGYTARWMIRSVAQQMPDFRQAMLDAGYDFDTETPADRQPVGTVDAEFVEPLERPFSTGAALEIMQRLKGATILDVDSWLDDQVEYVRIATDHGAIELSSSDMGLAFQPVKEQAPC
jgi:hypothetical protein